MNKGRISIAIVLLFLGMMVAVQFRSVQELEDTPPIGRAQELTSRLREVKEERDALIGQVHDLRRKLDEAGTGKSGADKALKDELDKARMAAGLVPVKGPGVQVTLNDSPRELKPGEDPNLYLLHEEDLLKVINELRAGGAESLAINGQRLLATSEIRCAGNTILVNTKKIAPPVVIVATGNPDTLKSGLEIKGGIFEQLKFWGLVADVKKMNSLTVPAYTGPVTFSNTNPAKEGE